MTSLRFDEVLIISTTERSARKISFREQKTAIIGENDTGKSSLLKSLLWAFGAEPEIINPAWTNLGISALVKFRVDDVSFSILRTAGLFALFDNQDAHLWTATKITTDLAPKLATLFKFGLKMESRSEEFITPPPAYMLSPFYVDQDSGWKKAWASFARMQMFGDYRKSLALFHAGMRPNEYYEAQSVKQKADRTRDEFRKERSALDRTATRLQSGRQVLSFNLNPQTYNSRVDELMSAASRLQRERDEIRTNIGTLHTEQALLVEQVNIADVTLHELEKDFDYIRRMPDSEVICPTCGTVHANDFASKFSLISDADHCRTFLIEARQELTKIRDRISIERASLRGKEQQVQEIESILRSTSGDFSLQDVLQAESERLVDIALQKEGNSIDSLISQQMLLSSQASSRMKSFKNPRRDEAIRSYFANYLSLFLYELEVPGLPDSVYKTVYASIPETGSDLPRALLAYYYAFARTAYKFSSSLLAPIIVDSPIQQDPDVYNAARIIEFVSTRSPPDAQVIIGTVRLHGVEFPGEVIELGDSRSLLHKEAYEEISATLSAYLDQLI